MNDFMVAIDLGGTQIRAALCNADGHILKQARQATLAAEGPEAVFARIVACVRQVVQDWTRVRAIGLGSPGPLDSKRGVILEARNLPGMTNFQMKARLEAEFRVPAHVGNDANLAALAEHRFGAGRGVSHMIYMTISTGIGGGIIADGKLFLGWRGFAGEVGHQTLEPRGPLCTCGNHGDLEALASGPAIVRDAREALAQGRASRMRAMCAGEPGNLDGAMVTQAAREGDPLARELLERAGSYIGLGIANLLTDFDTELFVLGGSVAAHAWDLLYPAMIAELDRRAMPSTRKGVRIVQAQLGDDVGLLGAAVLAMTHD
ncbi:MAG: ROK family protein [Chloroflexota bacterium]|nr:ROK family protein [Chloroflexota bacterium]